MRGPGVEDERPVILREDLCAPGVDEQHGLPRGEEPNRSRRVLIRNGCPRHGKELITPLVPKAAKRHPLHHRGEDPNRQPGPAGHVLHRCRAESSEVPPNEVLDALDLGRRRPPHPIVGQAVQVGPPLIPRPRRRHPPQVDPHPQTRPCHRGDPLGGEELLQLRGPARSRRQVLADPTSPTAAPAPGRSTSPDPTMPPRGSPRRRGAPSAPRPGEVPPPGACGSVRRPPPCPGPRPGAGTGPTTSRVGPAGCPKRTAGSPGPRPCGW